MLFFNAHKKQRYKNLTREVEVVSCSVRSSDCIANDFSQCDSAKYPRKTLAHFQSNNDNNKQQEASTMYVLQN